MTVKVVDGIPVAGGKPAVKIMTAFEEKIGLPNYSSVTVGPISVSRFVEDGDDEHILREIRETALIVEKFLEEERANILEMVQKEA